MTLVDAIVAGSLFTLVLSGWSKGILRALIGPLSLTISIGLGVLWFNQTKNFAVSFLIVFLGPILLRSGTGFFLSLWYKPADKKAPLSAASRLSGGLFNLAWGLGILIFLALTISSMPAKALGASWVKERISQSFSYQVVERWIIKKMPYENELAYLLNTWQDEEKIKEIRALPRFQEIQENPKMKDALSDTDTTAQIKDKDFAKLLINPKFLALLKDRALMQKIIDLNADILKGKKKF